MQSDQTARGRVVRQLMQDEKILTRYLYEEAFPEDGERLTDYYYREKMRDNEVFAALEDAGPVPAPVDLPGRAPHVTGMVCLNPYRVMIRRAEYPLSYIVAVATEKSRRRQGIMREVLTAALRHMRDRSEQLRSAGERGIPFTYLKPADPAYYTPFGFAYASRREHRVIREDAGLSRRTAADLTAAGAFMNRFLAEHSEVYCLRDARYLQCLAAELSAADGRLEILTGSDGEIVGTEVYDYPDVPEGDTRLILKEEFSAPCLRSPAGDPGTEAGTVPPSPFIMARIVDLPAFLEIFSAERDMEFRFRFDDPVIPENSGLWRWSVRKDGSGAERIAAGSREDADLCCGFDAGAAAPALTPEYLTQWLFGYGLPAPAGGEEIRPLRGVWFDEET